MEYDVAIVGLGPAGSILARYLDKGLRVIALDKKREAGEDGFHKPCGGLLAPDAQKALARLGLTLPVKLLVDPQIFSVRTIDVKAGKQRHYQRHYMNLNRQEFDRWPISLIPQRVALHRNAACVDIHPQPSGYRVDYRENGTIHSVTARYVVGADGAASVVRKKLYPAFRSRTYLSIQQWFENHHATPFYSCVFDPDATDCYAWGLTKNQHFIFGGAFAVKTGKQDFARLKEKLMPYGFPLAHPVKTEACLTMRPTGPGSFCLGGDGAFLVGEAAGFISPSSLEGISYAIDSGYLLSRCLNRQGGDPNRAYRKGSRKIRGKLLLKNLKSPFMYHPVLRRWVMASGLNSISVREK